MRLFRCVLLAMLAASAAFARQTAPEEPLPAPDRLALREAERIARDFAKGELGAMQQALAANPLPGTRIDLAVAREDIMGQHGRIQRIRAAVPVAAGKAWAVRVPFLFEKSGELDLELQLVGNEVKAGTVVGWAFSPHKDIRRPTPPPPEMPKRAPYVDAARFKSREVIVSPDRWPTRGIFTAPVAEGKFPAVLLLPGDGPQDADDRQGAAAPLRDIAQALAANGVASLRIDKRAVAHGAKLAAMEFTLEEEYLEDARAALAVLRAQPETDRKFITVAGRGLGAVAALAVAGKDPDVNAVALLAPPSGTGVRELRGRVSQALAEGSLNEAEAAHARAKIDLLERGEMTRGDSLFGVPASYWQDLIARNPIADAQTFSGPLLFAFGRADTAMPWRRALAGRGKVQFHKYEGMADTLLPKHRSGAGGDHPIPALVRDLTVFCGGRVGDSTP